MRNAPSCRSFTHQLLAKMLFSYAWRSDTTLCRQIAVNTGETEEEDMAHPIQRARQALRNAELHAESAEYPDGDVESGPGQGLPIASRISK